MNLSLITQRGVPALLVAIVVLSSSPHAPAQVAPAGFEEPAPPTSADVAGAFAANIDELRQSGIVERAVGVGDRAVDFELPLANGTNLRLSELWAVGPVVLVYYRGNWCPFCNRHLQRLQQTLDEIQAADAQLVAVSPERSTHGLETQVKDGLKFPTLTDEGNTVARQYGIVYRIGADVAPFYNRFFDIEDYNGDRSYELPLAATYVIDTDGIVRYAFVSTDFTQRADPREIVRVLRRLKESSPPRPTTLPLARR